MPLSLRRSTLLTTFFCAALLAGCGGATGSAATSQRLFLPATEAGAPRVTGDIAQDGFNWLNFRRRQLGIPVLARNNRIDIAAQGHANYQKLNNTIAHDQTPGLPGFTGSLLLHRLTGANYLFAQNTNYAYGEVISATDDPSGFYMAEELITAIYHRFVIFEPAFKEAGAGAAVAPGGAAYFTTDFAANNGYGPGLGRGHIVTYPFADQQRVARNFYSDLESPDPVPNQNEVGFPISIHADMNAILSVQSFTVRPHGGAPLAVQLMTASNDRETPRSAAAIIPLAALAPNTRYEVEFAGAVNQAGIHRVWSFSTR